LADLTGPKIGNGLTQPTIGIMQVIVKAAEWTLIMLVAIDENLAADLRMLAFGERVDMPRG
jgi:hypothetical protein